MFGILSYLKGIVKTAIEEKENVGENKRRLREAAYRLIHGRVSF